MTERPAARTSMLRGVGADEVTNVELFFDLVYVFAVTQLSHLLVTHPSGRGWVYTAVLLAMVWQVWVYTTWAVNYLDPNRAPARAMLVAAMLGSLVLAAGLPQAFHGRAVVVAGAYVAIQVGRLLFLIWALRGERLQIVFVRILPWTCVSSVVMLLGTTVDGWPRASMWAGSVAIDLVAAGFGFYVPGLGGSATTEWTISGAHFAERCQAFVLIALGESIVVLGALVPLHDPSGHDIVAFGVAFLGAVALWWVYFDRAAEDSAREIAASRDPGRLARNAFHWLHPFIVAGIIVVAAADEKVLEHPTAHGSTSTSWLVLGGTALFLGGHAAFKAMVWRTVSWPRVIGTAVLLALGALAPHAAALTLAVCAFAVVVAVALADRVLHPTANLDA